MKPKRIMLLRHGESLGNADKSIYAKIPTHKFGLTERGKEQAKDAAVNLYKICKNETIKAYVSPYQRTRETFKIISDYKPTSLKICITHEEPRLREQDHGHLRDERTLKQNKEECYNYSQFYYRFPDGESGADVYDRISTFLESLHRDFTNNTYDNFLIVSHGLTMRLFLMRWFHKSIEEFESWDNPDNCQIYTLTYNSCDGYYNFPNNVEIYKGE